jgi:hypothetical protein
MDAEGYKNDIEEKVSPEVEGTPVNFWEAKQRELVISVVDYNLGSLADLIEDKTIDLKPQYQRRERWDAQRQSKLIESFLMNVPVPPIYLNEDRYGKYSVIDGKQRLLSIHAFMRGKLTLTGLEVFKDINGLNIEGLPDQLRQIMRVRPTLRAIIVLKQSDEDVKLQVFRRLNTGGISLNAQEIRNSAYTGPLNDLILQLSESPSFHKLLQIRNRESSRIYKEMRDAEFVLRFFTFREKWESFGGAMGREMDHFMEEHRHAREKLLRDLSADFTGTIEAVDAAFGEHAFRRWMPENRKWRRAVLASLFDAQMFACRGFPSSLLLGNRNKIATALQELFEDRDFRRSIDAATNSPSYFKTRIERIRAILEVSLAGGRNHGDIEVHADLPVNDPAPRSIDGH